jgi:hypothetical protein
MRQECVAMCGTQQGRSWVAVPFTDGRAGKKLYGREEKRRRRREDEGVEEDDAGVVWVGGGVY